MRVVVAAFCALCASHTYARKVMQENSAELVVQEERGAREAFKEALPLVGALEMDVARVQQSSRRADQILIQRGSTSAHLTTKAKLAAKPISPKTVLSQGTVKKQLDTGKAVKDMGKLGLRQMPAMLRLINGMYSAWKDKITFANKHEQQGKISFEQEVKDLDARKRKCKGDLNATKTYDHIERYWKKQRDLAHRQYHTALKIMHSGMSQFKSVMSAMQDAADGKKPTPDELRMVGRLLPPEVVLLQRKVKELAVWAKGAVSLLRDSRNTHPGMAYSAPRRT